MQYQPQNQQYPPQYQPQPQPQPQPQAQYQYVPQAQPVLLMAQPQGSNGLALASWICAMVAWLINPFCLVALAAVILGIVGLCKCPNKALAAIGLCLGACALIWEIAWDLFLVWFTLGLSLLI